MFQKFNVDTLVGRFIQSLLYNTYIPLYKSVWEGDYIVKDCLYIYDKTVIRCTKTGFLSGGDMYEPITHVDLNRPDYTFMSNLFSSNNYYDSETHRQLGEYLRYLKYNENLDLMPFYNCFNADYTSNFSIERGEYHEGVDETKQVVLVPIQFNRTYTIAVDCPSTLEILPIMLADRKPLSTVVGGQLIDLNNTLKNYYQCRAKTSFSSPFTIQINLTDDAFEYNAAVFESNQKCLYLVLQLPVDDTSSIVVLEGNYVNNRANKHFDVEHISEISQKEIDESFISELSLLRINDNNSYAFSDRLLEHLLLNAINNTETIDNNIYSVQRLLGMSTADSLGYKGVWTDDIRYKAYNEYNEGRGIDYRFEMIDIDGFIDKDIEQFLLKRGM